jgi:iron(III) transport system ATP-binding protein
VVTGTVTDLVDRVPTEHEPAEPPAVRLVDVEKSFRRANGTMVKPIDHISLDIAPGEFIVLLGPSGCGKTTLLRSIAGLEQPEHGRIEIQGKAVFDGAKSGRIDVPPERRHIGMIFQSYALWPHLTVIKNVAYPLRTAGVRKAEAMARAAEALEVVGVGEVGGQLPHRLSGGQQQRVALARAMVARPQLILFDEPLSNVDAKVREELRLELLKTQRDVGFTGIYVTHDQAEALELADRIVVLRDGRIEQVGLPREVYSHPRSAYVADFVGTANRVSGVLSEDSGDALSVTTPGATLRAGRAASLQSHGAVGQEVEVLWRPERTRVSLEPRSDGLEATVLAARFLGPHDELICRTVDGDEVSVVSTAQVLPPEGAKLWLTIDPEDLWVFAGDAARRPGEDAAGDGVEG